jgi:glucosamine--fructose-6-phosphate aminotransferase (isomerizing)
VDAGEWLNYSSQVWDDAALSILLTTSGESAELVEFFKQAGNRALGLICNNPASACWHFAKNKLPILAGPEYGNATKTYTNAMAAAIILASEIVGYPWKEEAERAAEIFSSPCAASWNGSAGARLISRLSGGARPTVALLWARFASAR